MDKSLESVSADLNTMVKLNYFNDISFDLIYKEIIFSSLAGSGNPLPQIGDESQTVFEEKKRIPFLPIVAAVVTAVSFLPMGFGIPFVVFAVLLAVGAFLLVLKFFPASVYFVQVKNYSKLKKPVVTGNSDLDGTLAVIFENKKELVRLSQSIASMKIRNPLKEILRLLDQIAECVKENPEKVKSLRQFSNYYLPTTVNFLKTYEDLETKPDKGENINEAMKKIESVMTDVVAEFKREYDDLFSDVEMDVSADVSVMKAIIKENENII